MNLTEFLRAPEKSLLKKIKMHNKEATESTLFIKLNKGACLTAKPIYKAPNSIATCKNYYY